MIEEAKTEAELREAKDPWPKTIEELQEYVLSLTKREQDYGTCVYAMSLAAVAAFNFVAHEVGATGFQASCADFDFLKRSRGIKGGFILLKFEDMLYPQYDLRLKLEEAMEKQKDWLRDEAKKKLENLSGSEHEAVVAHWKKLADAT